MNPLQMITKLHDSANMLNKAMKNDPALKDDMKDYIRSESLKAGIRVGRLYTSVINDFDKIVKTIHLAKTSAELIGRIIEAHKQDLKTYVGGNITNTVKSIAIEMEEVNMELNNRITAAMFKEKESQVMQELATLTNNSMNEMNIIKNSLETQIADLEEEARDKAYFNYTHLNELKFKLACCEKLYSNARSEFFKKHVAAKNDDKINKSVDSI